MNPCATRNYKTLKIKNFQNRAAADLGFTRRCVRSPSVCDRSHCDRSPSFMHERRYVRSSSWALERWCARSQVSCARSPSQTPFPLIFFLAFPNSCPLSPRLPECSLFFQKAYKTEKTQKESKIDKIT